MAAAGDGDGAAHGSFEMEARSRPSVERRTRLETGPLPGDIASFALANAASGGLGETVATTRQGVSYNDAVITIIINATGVGLVIFPKVMAEVGIVMAPLLCAICALTCLECGVMICGACAIAEKLLGVDRIDTYEGLAETIGGASGKRFLTVTKNFALLGTITVYVQLFVDSLAAFIPGAAKDEKTLLALRFGVALPSFGLIAMMKDLSQLAKLSCLGIVAVIVECGSIVVGGSILAMELPPCQEGSTEKCLEYNVLPDLPPSQMLGAFGKYLSVFLFSYAVLAMVPSLRSQLQEPAEMHSILSRSFVILVCINCTVMGLGYAGFGDRVPDNVIQGLAEDFPQLGKVASAAIVVNVLISAPLNIFCVVSAFEATGTDELHTPLTVPNIVFRVGLIAFLCVVGAMLPYITEVIGIVSSVFACCNNILFPMTFHYLGRQQVNMAPQNPTWRQVKYVCSMVVGFTVLVFGFMGSVSTLVEKLKSGQ